MKFFYNLGARPVKSNVRMDDFRPFNCVLYILAGCENDQDAYMQ